MSLKEIKRETLPVIFQLLASREHSPVIGGSTVNRKQQAMSPLVSHARER